MREAITRSSEPISDKTRTWKGGSGCGDSFRLHFVFVMPRRSTTVLAYLMRDAIMGHQRSLEVISSREVHHSARVSRTCEQLMRDAIMGH